MEIRVPVFAGRRILKKESLWDIRDYTYAGWQLYYAEYTDGLLKGCDIRAEDGRLVIGKVRHCVTVIRILRICQPSTIR